MATVQCRSSDVITVSTDDRGTPLPGAAPGRQKAGDVGSGIMSHSSDPSSSLLHLPLKGNGPQ